MIPEPGGRFINDIDQQRKRRVIFIGNAVRDKFFGEGVNPVGRGILVNNVPFTVIGVMKKKMQTNAYSGMDEDRCCIPASTFRTMYNETLSQQRGFQGDQSGLHRKCQGLFPSVHGQQVQVPPGG